MRWYLFQGTIVFLGAASNIHWQWTPNGYVVALFGYLAAHLATWAVTRIISLGGR